MIATPPDPFDEWHALPVAAASDDSRFVVRRAHEVDFPKVWDCVDAAFGRKRPRTAYDWLYRANPHGRARCWIVEETATGRVLKTGAFFPWPIWRGDEVLRGSLSGDSATVPEWQRKGLSHPRRRVRRSHPWSRTIATIAGPNRGSRIVSKKAGESSSNLGALRGGVLVLAGDAILERVGLPTHLARPLGAAAAGLLGAATRLIGGTGQPTRLEPIRRFDRAFDEVTLATMRFPLYWCPHGADFLNWRYLDHPLESYAAFALVEADAPVAYCVLRLAGREATLSELAASPRRAPALLAAAIGVAREAGCAWLNFFATPSWRHWRCLRRAGFLPYRTNNHLEAVYWPRKEDSEAIGRWQVTPGDRDYH